MDKCLLLCYNLFIDYESSGEDMPFSLLPLAVTDVLTDLTPQWLRNRGIALLMMDFDNTIIPYTTNTPTPEVEAWLRNMASSGITICVVSNSRNDRVKIFCNKYQLPCVTQAKKPFSKGIKECLDTFGVPASEAALVGDQIFTDTLGGNCAGVTTILVKSIHNHNIWLKARHVLELPFIYLARKRRIDQ